MFTLVRSLAILSLAFASAACGSSAPALDGSVKDPVRRGYYDAMRSLVDGDYLEATTRFQVVASSPRTSKYAALAKLRLGDALFYQERYAEATELYRGFTNQYKSDPNLPYARYRVAECYFERLPSDWFAAPPAYEMDQTLTQQAEAELKGFLSQFPTSRYAASARQMLAETRLMLYRTEMYAVDFYAAHHKWQAVAWRLKDAMDTYPELAVKEARVWQMSRAWRHVGQDSEVARSLGLYLEKFPDGAHVGEAKAELEAIRQGLDKKPDAAPAAPEKKPDAKPKADKNEPAPSRDEPPTAPDDEELKLRPPDAGPLAPDPL
ncbi:MAG: outer membrane protein assembly factor BamD [Myxococcota bacterium]